MNRKLLIWLAGCIMTAGLHAETIRVLRFVPLSGAESEVELSSLQKVVFTQDSVLLVSALDGEATPVYKYDYRSILFAKSSSPETAEPIAVQHPQTVKFIRNGQLYIRRDEQVFNIFGNKIK